MTLRTVFMGTPEIAVPTLRCLAERTHVQCVVTQPDRPAGRGNKLQPSPVKQAALALHLPLWQPETLKGYANNPNLQNADLFIVLAYGELLRQDILDLPRGGCINLHGSLLPRWRGASPLQAALRAGDQETGMTVMRMVRGLDAGPIYLHEKIAITKDMTLPVLHDAMAELAAKALGRFLDAYPKINVTPQDDSMVTMCRKLLPEDGHLDFTQTSHELVRWVQAYTPAPGCWAITNNERMRILSLRTYEISGNLAPGQIAIESGNLVVGCGEGACIIERLQPPGKKAMLACDYLNGHQPPTQLL